MEHQEESQPQALPQSAELVPVETEQADKQPIETHGESQAKAQDEAGEEALQPPADPGKVRRFYDQLNREQQLPLGLLAGLGAAVIGAVLWAAITVITEFQIGYMAVAIGFMVGYAIRYAGKGMDRIFGISGAALSLFGCLLGNFLSIIGFAANQYGLGYIETLGMVDLDKIPGLMLETFNPIDFLFYGIAIYEGYRFSFRVVSDGEWENFAG